MYWIAYGLSYALWAVLHLTGEYPPSLGFAVPLTVETVLKSLVWIGPMLIVFLKYGEPLVPLRQTFRKPFPWYPTLIGLCLTVVLLHTAHIFISGIDTWGIFSPMWIWLSLSAAVIEEIAFRGLLFNGQAASMGVGKAAALNGVLFAFYHFPELILGQNLSAAFGLRFWVIAVAGWGFSLAFAKWKHLGMTVVIPFVWNMLCHWFAVA